MSFLARIRTSHRAVARHTHNYPRLPHTRSKAGALVLGHSLAHRSASLRGYGLARHSHGNSAEASAVLSAAQRRAARRAIRQQHRNVVNQKLADQVLRNNLISAMHGMQKGRAGTIAHKMLDFSGLRTEAKQVKAQALAHLPAMLQSFEQQATAHGIKVHYASNGDQVCTILYELMRAHGVTHVIKGKSIFWALLCTLTVTRSDTSLQTNYTCLKPTMYMSLTPLLATTCVKALRGSKWAFRELTLPLPPKALFGWSKTKVMAVCAPPALRSMWPYVASKSWYRI